MIPAADESEQSTKYAFAIKKITDYILTEGIYSPQNIFDMTGINTHALNQFKSRPIERVKYSATLHKMYRFIANGLDPDLIKDREVFVLVRDIRRSGETMLSDSIDVYKRFIEHMDVSFNRINRVCLNYSGTFYIYRNSVIPGRVVKTKMRIFEDESMEKMWKFEHSYKDGMGVVRETTGVILVMIGTVYCLGKVGSGLGLDLIAFREPSTVHQPVIQALITSVDTRYQPIVGRAIIKYAGDDDEQWFGSFNFKQPESATDNIAKNEIQEFFKYISNPEDNNRIVTLNVR